MEPQTDYFVSWVGEDGPEISWFVTATNDEMVEIEAWLDRVHKEDWPTLCPIVPIAFEQFKADTMFEDEEDDEPAADAG